MGLQVSHSVDTEMQEEVTVWGNCEASGKDVPRIGAATGKQDIGRAPVPGSYPYADRDTAEVRSIGSSWIHQGKECDSDSPDLSGEAAKFHRTKFLGEGYCVSTVGRDEQAIKKYIREQEAEDKRQDQLELFKDNEQR
jgi:hypothetical protein